VKLSGTITFRHPALRLSNNNAWFTINTLTSGIRQDHGQGGTWVFHWALRYSGAVHVQRVSQSRRGGNRIVFGHGTSQDVSWPTPGEFLLHRPHIRTLILQWAGIATRYGLDGPGIKSRGGGGDFPLPSTSIPTLGPTQLSAQWVQSLFPWGKAARAWGWPRTPL
jgi:hypothetical protein